jgi:hypothetical protein
MTKKIISSMAAASILATAASAAGQHLVFPAFFTGSGWETSIKIVNTSGNAVVAKAVLYDGKDSHEIKDFNIYLSANDATEFKIKEASTGVYQVYGTDSSLPTIVNNTQAQASTTNPLSSNFAAADSNFGYVVVYSMADTSAAANTGIAKTYHQKHAELRLDYEKVARLARTTSLSPTVLFNANGVWQGHIDDQTCIAAGTGQDLNGTSAANPTSLGAGINVKFDRAADNLIGYARITDTINGKDMVANATQIKAATGSSRAVFWIEGEAARFDQAFGTNATGTNKAFTSAELNTTIATAKGALADVTGAYVNYGESASFVDNIMLVTQPLKRIVVENNNTATSTAAGTASDGAAANYYSAVTKSSAGAITSYGCMNAQLSIYNMDEVAASASQFSPASTPLLTMCNEVASTETTTGKKMSQFLTETGFTAGYLVANFIDTAGNGKSYDAIVSQMLATTAGGKVVTNWFTPVCF